ncbi:MAG: hypothetical protein JST26_00220 [Bacteroidetes bacterium]|nr:hypothetical protein [Bacteroidota bacterium]
MEKNRSIKRKEITVPLDIMMDIAKIIVETEMESTITGLNENKNTVQIILGFPEELNYYKKALDNIDSILNDYKHYRFEEEAEDWRDQ